jgi:hypothetical protein
VVAAFAGLLWAPAAWAIYQQAGSNYNFGDCVRGGAGFALAGALLTLAISAACAVLCWMQWRAERRSAAWRMIALLGLLLSGLFCITALVQIAANILVPSCFR